MTLTLSSSAFLHQHPIPHQYTCIGDKNSPPLTWEHPPKTTQTYTLTMQDLSVPFGTLTHWILYNIPHTILSLPENIANTNPLPNGIRQGINGMRRQTYLPPCPPFGSTHTYQFTLYALDIQIDHIPKMNLKRLIKTISPHILEKAILNGTYSKKQPYFQNHK